MLGEHCGGGSAEARGSTRDDRGDVVQFHQKVSLDVTWLLIVAEYLDCLPETTDSVVAGGDQNQVSASNLLDGH
jgi:hypothetical protein